MFVYFKFIALKVQAGDYLNLMENLGFKFLFLIFIRLNSVQLNMLYWCKWVEVDTEVLFHKSFPPEKFFIQYFSALDVLAVRFALHTWSP